MEEKDLVGKGNDLLLGLLRSGKLQGGQLRDYIPSYEAAVKIARNLEKHGLITITITKERRIVHYYELTEKGKKVAELLARADDLIHSS